MASYMKVRQSPPGAQRPLRHILCLVGVASEMDQVRQSFLCGMPIIPTKIDSCGLSGANLDVLLDLKVPLSKNRRLHIAQTEMEWCPWETVCEVESRW
jgi:hypothetical protein